MRRFLQSSRIRFLAGALALSFGLLPSLAPLCRGAQAVSLSKHDCCAGSKACHTAIGRKPCCEMQGAPVGTPAIPVAADSVSAPPVLLNAALFSFPEPPRLFSPGFAALGAGQVHAPPLYLAKQSLLC